MFPFPSAGFVGFVSNGFPYRLLAYVIEAFGIYIALQLQGILFINIALAFIMHPSICFDNSSRIACDKRS